jgi:hypothetical protein
MLPTPGILPALVTRAVRNTAALVADHIKGGDGKIKIRWKVTDGGAGDDGYHRLEVPEHELAECEDDDERAAVIEEHVFDELTRVVGFSWQAEA